MKRNAWTTIAAAVILSMCIALGAIGCVITAFHLEVDDWVHLICMMVLLTAVTIACLQIRFGELVLSLLVLITLIVLLRYTSFPYSVERLLNSISEFYDQGYGWGVLQWSGEPLENISIDGALVALACMVILAVCWVICRSRWFGFAIFAGLIPLFACCIVTDTIPDNFYLFLLLAGLLLVTMSQRLRSLSQKDADRLVAMLLIPVLLITSLAFASDFSYQELTYAQHIQEKLVKMGLKLSELGILPSGLIDVPVDGPDTGGPGQSPGVTVYDTIQLSDVGPLNQGENTVFYVTTISSGGPLYLRGKAYDYYTGTSWNVAIDSTGENGWIKGKMGIQDRITITTPKPSTIRYFGYYPYGEGWSDDIYNGALPNRDLSTEYSFPIYAPLSLSAVNYSKLHPDEEKAYLALPESTREAAEQILLLMDISPEHNTEQIANTIGRYVRNSATYSINTDKMPSDAEDFAIWFLEEAETGYCMHFASAAAVLLRAAGIPARYVVGYMTYVAPNSKCAVTADQAHAWVEYLHPRTGWTVLDATPSTGGTPNITPPETQPTQPTEPPITVPTVPPTEPSTDPSGTTAPPTEPPTDPSGTTVPPTNPSGTTAPPTVTVPVTTPTVPFDTAPPTDEAPRPTPANLKWIRVLLIILAVWALIGLQYRLRRCLRRRKLDRGSPNRQALNRWRYAQHLAKITGLSAEPLHDLAEKAAFSQHTLSEEELAVFDEWFHQADQALLKKPWLLQLALRLLFAIV